MSCHCTTHWSSPFGQDYEHFWQQRMGNDKKVEEVSFPEFSNVR